MTTRKRIKLRGYDYMAGHLLVVVALEAAGESRKLSPTEDSMVDHAIEIAADKSYTAEQAEAVMRETAAYIVRTRNETLFPAFDERDNLGDDSAAPQYVQQDAFKAVA